MNRVIAIDGPAASGKSTVARRVAGELGFIFVSSGAMYRAFTWWVLENGIDSSDREAVLRLLDEASFETIERDGAGVITVCGRDPENELLSAAVNAQVSPVSAYPEVRARLLAEQRACAERSDVVMEGRDIGSVVFPETPHKFYIDASPEVRERRRRDQGQEDSIRDRDRQDSTRDTAPLKVADGAVVIDSSKMGVEEVVGVVLARLAEDGVSPRKPGKETERR
jgi:cytidylate kinase